MPTKAKKTTTKKTTKEAVKVDTTKQIDTTPLVQQVVYANPHNLPIVYDKINMIECSTVSPRGPIYAEQAKAMMQWETEKEYAARMVQEKPDSKPEHWIYGDDYHCLDTDGVKVRCWANAGNRPFDARWSRAMSDTTLYGQWAGPHTVPNETVNGETIRISRYGRVLSGQHQLTGLVIADELLLKSRKLEGNAANPKYPFWNGHEHPFIETIVITGLSEDERVLRTIDYVKPRTVGDMLYTMEVFRSNTPTERKEMTRVLAAAIDLLWERTDTQGYGTHPEIVGFLERHNSLLDCVEHVYKENLTELGSGGRKITLATRIPIGHTAALCYLMGASGPKTDGDDYRNDNPPCEDRNVDWSYWDKALLFWKAIGKDSEFMPLRTAFVKLRDSRPGDPSNQGMGGTAAERIGLVCKAWFLYRDHPRSAGPVFDMSDVELGGRLRMAYNNLDENQKVLPDGEIAFLDEADFRGIDCPTTLSKKKRRKEAPSDGPMPPAPTGEAYERLKQEALERREAEEKAAEEEKAAKRAEQRRKLLAARDKKTK